MALGFRIYSKYETSGAAVGSYNAVGEAKIYTHCNKSKYGKRDVSESPFHDGRARRGQPNGSVPNHLCGQSGFIIRSSSFSETSALGRSRNLCLIHQGWASWPSSCHHPSKGDWGQTEFPLSSCFRNSHRHPGACQLPPWKTELAVVSCKWYWVPAQSLLPMRCWRTTFLSSLVMEECWVVFPLFEASTLKISSPSIPGGGSRDALDPGLLQLLCGCLRVDLILSAPPPECPLGVGNQGLWTRSWWTTFCLFWLQQVSGPLWAPTFPLAQWEE